MSDPIVDLQVYDSRPYLLLIAALCQTYYIVLKIKVRWQQDIARTSKISSKYMLYIQLSLLIIFTDALSNLLSDIVFSIECQLNYRTLDRTHIYLLFILKIRCWVVNGDLYILWTFFLKLTINLRIFLLFKMVLQYFDSILSSNMLMNQESKLRIRIYVDLPFSKLFRYFYRLQA